MKKMYHATLSFKITLKISNMLVETLFILFLRQCNSFKSFRNLLHFSSECYFYEDRAYSSAAEWPQS